MIRFLQSKSGIQKVMLGIVVAIVSVSMVAFLGDYFRPPSDQETTGVYAFVGAQQVTSQAIQERGRREAQQMVRGGQIPEFLLPNFYQRAANTLVTQAALVAEAERLGLQATPIEVKEELRTGQLGQQLFPGGKFIGQEQYRGWVNSVAQMDIPTFENEIRKQVLLQKLLTMITGGVTVSPKEVQEAFNKSNIKVKFDYAIVQTSDLMKRVNVTEPELRAYYDNNKGRWQNSIPEQRKLRYAVIDLAKVNVQITDDDYQRAYESRKEQFAVQESVDVRHILVKTKEQALDLKKQLEAGANFGVLAKKFSEDPGSKENGGLYEGVVRKQFVPEFEQVAFSIPIGQVSDPVQTTYGFHIIKADARRGGGYKPLNEVKAELESAIRAEKQNATAQEQANKLLDDARRNGLEKAGPKYGVNVITTDFVPQTASLPGIGPAQAALQQVFKLQPKAPGELVNLPNGFAIFEVLDLKPAATPSFEQIRAQVENAFRSERAQQMLAQRTAELADRARALKNLRAAAKEVGAAVKTSELVTPNAQVAELGSLSGPAATVFDLKPGQISGPIQAGNNGAVVALLQRQEPKPDEFERQKPQLNEQLLDAKRNEVLQVYALELRQRMIKDGKIRINAREQERLFGGNKTVPFGG